MSSVSKSLLQGAQEALDYAEGNTKGSKTRHVHVPKQIDVKSIRETLHMSRSEFSSHFGFNPRTIEKWEQGVRQPDGSARAYLTVISKNPKAVERALKQ